MAEVVELLPASLNPVLLLLLKVSIPPYTLNLPTNLRITWRPERVSNLT